jgi:outer membrane protein assembly factor BamB/predicted phosphodiesterase
MTPMRRSALLTAAVFFAATAISQTLTFAWLSDTHVGSTTGARDLEESVRDINARDDVRFVLLSGDITESGSDAELQLAKELLDSLRVPYHLIPGNHDTKWSESGGTTFRALWGDDRFDFREEGFRFLGMHQGPRMRMADGHWAPEDVRWLDSVSRSIGPDEPVFFVTHYPIDSSIANWYVVLDRLKKLNVQLALVGHGHRNRVDSYEGIPGAMGRSNLSGRNGSAGYTIGRIRGDSCILAERQPSRGSETRWLALQLSRRTPSPAGERPSYAVNSLYPNVRTVWEYATGFTVAAGPALWDTLVFVGDGSGAVTALGLESGKRIWRTLARGPIYSTPAAADGRVLVGSTDSTIYCLDARSGELSWSLHTGAAVLGSAALNGGVAYIGDRAMRAIDVGSGRVLWEFKGLEGFVECRPLVVDGKVIFGAWDGRLYALDARDGKLLWTWQGEPGRLYSPAACWPVASGKRLFIVDPDRKMTSLDIETGKNLWRSGRHQVRESIGISENGEAVFVRLMRDTIMAFATGEDEKVLWATAAGFGYDINSAMLVEKGGRLFYGTKNGLILALDAQHGTILWKHRVGPGAVHTVEAVSATSILAADFDGIVRRLTN